MENNLLVFLLLPLVFGAQSAIGAPKPRHKAKKKLPIVPVESVFHAADAPISANTKIFLVAGSSLSASFAREVVEQRKLWLKAGFQENEIACYYIVPLQEDLNDNQKQFLEIAPELSKCYAMSAKLLRRHFRALARSSSRPRFIYLYISSHGDKPASYTLKETKTSDEDYWAIKRDAAVPAFDQYQLLIEGLPDGTATSPEVYGALRAGMSPEDLYLTPRYLRDSLSENFADTPKFIVLQGCFSGGFIEEDNPRFTPDLLTSLHDVTVLTAARHDRSSFGCEPGGRTTFFGEAYEQALAHYLGDPIQINWKELFESLKQYVTALEKREKTSPPSLPQFFSNR